MSYPQKRGRITVVHKNGDVEHVRFMTLSAARYAAAIMNQGENYRAVFVDKRWEDK